MGIIEKLKRKMPLSAEAAAQEKAELIRLIEKNNDQIQKNNNQIAQMMQTLEALEKINEKIDEQSKQSQQFEKKMKNTEQIIHDRAGRLEMAKVHCMPRAQLSFEVAIAEHCNLNCRGCDHFSPLAKPELADLEETSRDFARIAELFKNRINEIHLLGGEPLLHPRLTDFFEAARKCFPDALIDMTTNGIDLLKKEDSFWESCKKNRIVIRPTKYPISLDYDSIEQKAAQFGVDYRYFGNTGTVVKTLNCFPLDLEGTQNGSRNFLLCHRANSCVYLQHGRLYTCTVAPTIGHFNNFFGTNLKLLPEDSIDIYEAQSAEEILEFLAKPIPFCRYCMVDKVKRGLLWEKSKKNIQEWTL